MASVLSRNYSNTALLLVSIIMSGDIVYEDYTDESMMPDIQRLVTRDLSEPYSIYTYRFFLHNWPRYCICAYAVDPADSGKRTMIATVVCKMEGEGDVMQGYMAMLAVDQDYRKRGIAKTLVTMVIDRMVEDGCREVMLEAEVSKPMAVMKFGLHCDKYQPLLICRRQISKHLRYTPSWALFATRRCPSTI